MRETKKEAPEQGEPQKNSEARDIEDRRITWCLTLMMLLGKSRMVLNKKPPGVKEAKGLKADHAIYAHLSPE